jgi:hypothetical protein
MCFVIQWLHYHKIGSSSKAVARQALHASRFLPKNLGKKAAMPRAWPQFLA